MFQKFAKFPLLLLLLLLNSSSFGQWLTPQWQKNYGGSQIDVANDILATRDGGSILVGYSFSNDGDFTDHHGSTESSDGFVLKLDAAGNIAWLKSLGGTASDVFESILQTPDNGFLCIGYSSSIDGDLPGNFGSSDRWLLKLSSNGTIEWSKNYGDAGPNYAFDGSMINGDECGIIGANNFDNIVGVVFKVDMADGSMLWQTTFVNNSANVSRCIVTKGNQLITSLGLSIDQSTGNTTQLPWNLVNRQVKSMKISNGETYSTIMEDFDNILSVKLGILANGNNDFVYRTVATSYSDNGIGSSGFYTTKNHCLAVMPDNQFLVAGLHSSIGKGGGFNSSFVYNGSNFDYYDADPVTATFDAITAFPNGNEYLCVGAKDIFGGAYNIRVKKFFSKNVIKGQAFFDWNNNLQRDANEPACDYATIQSVKGNGGYAYTSPLNGNFANMLDTGSYITTLQLPNTSFFSYSPMYKASNFTTYGLRDSVNFAIRKTADVYDCAVFLSSAQPVRPGFNSSHFIFCTNNGSMPLINVRIKMVKDPRISYASGIPEPRISGDTLQWTIDTLNPGESRSISVYGTAAIPPLLNLDDTVTNSVSVDTAGDFTPGDNNATLAEIVTGSFDPNDKFEAHGTAISPAFIAQQQDLIYTIRFQNTGNAEAYNIIVKDTLDANVELASFKMNNASHPYTLKVENGKYITWTFSNIYLKDSVHNEPESHGFISYRIKPKNTLETGDSIHNRAAIYFDFNQPVITNNWLTLVSYKEAIWEGNISSEWENPLNWSSGSVPDEKTKVRIPAQLRSSPVINSNASCFSLTVDANAEITVNSGFEVIVHGK